MKHLALAAALGLAPAVALAHEGDHTHMTAAQGVRHLLTQPDHLMVLALLVAIVAFPLVRLARRRVRR